MSNARVEFAWAHTSSLMALIANCHRDPRQRALEPREFNPLKKKQKPPKVDITILKDLFCKETKP